MTATFRPMRKRLLYEFLSILERDLKSNDPAVLGLLRPADTGVFGSSPSRTGLLWALEGLAWNPETLPRAAAILARLAEVEINDNWINKPTNSLESIFRAWMPQTAANHQQRVGTGEEVGREVSGRCLENLRRAVWQSPSSRPLQPQAALAT